MSSIYSHLRLPVIAFFSPKQALNASSSSHVQESCSLSGAPLGPRTNYPLVLTYNLQNGALAACTATTLRLFAGRKGYPLTRIQVSLSYRHGATGDLDSFDRTMHLEGDLPREQTARLLQAASLCPVGKTSRRGADVQTVMSDSDTGGLRRRWSVQLCGGCGGCAF